MIIGAISDLDVLGIQLDVFWDVLKKTKKPDLLLFAGDMYDFRSPEHYETILDFLKMRKWNCPIIGVFGNHEFVEDRDYIKKITKGRITFLEEESITLKIKGKTIGIVGSEGALDTPAIWMFGNVLEIRDEADQIRNEIKKKLDALKTDIKLLLTHYAPTHKTLKGETKGLYDSLGSKEMEEILIDTNTTLAIHGHAHYGIPMALVENIPVFNVCYLINKDITLIDTEKLPNKA